MVLMVPLDREGPVPLARQIHTHLERLIREGRLLPGVKLPATRELARALGVNRATVTLAYEELGAAGFTRAHVGQGTFVAERDGVEREGAERERDGRDGASEAGRRAAPLDWAALFSRATRIAAAEQSRALAFVPPVLGDGVVSFAGGMPDSALFPMNAFRRVLNDVVREGGPALFQYHAAGGYPPLRAHLATYLLRFGIEARPDEILIVNGSQQGFDLIARTLIDPGDVVAVEQPTYPRAMQVFRGAGAALAPVPWDAEGPRADALERAFERRRPKFFYCQPTAHNPTGLTMSPAAARRLLRLAARHQVAVVEDGFDGSLYYGSRPPLPLRALDRDGVVLYLGTFSKVLFPGLRLGWIVAPSPLVERLQLAKQLADLHTSPLLQAAVARFCERSFLDRHAARAAEQYGRRRAALLAALERHRPAGVSWTEPRGGFSLLLTLPPGCAATALLPIALRRGVAFTPGPAFFVDGGGEEMLRLSFSAVPVARIEDGVRRLAEAIAETRRRPRVGTFTAPAAALVV